MRILLVLLLSACVTVPAGNLGVETYGGKVHQVLEPGVHYGPGYWFHPLVAVKQMSVQVQGSDFSTNASSKDLQNVTTEVTLNWRRPEDQVINHYENYPGILNRVIEPAVHEAVKAVTAHYTAEELITERPAVKAAIEEQLSLRLTQVGIIIDAVQITEFAFSQKFDDAIEAKMEAEQNALKASNDLNRIRIEAEQIAATAEGQAAATLAKARAEAEGIELRGEALKRNPGVIDWERTQKWDGKLPTTLLTADNTPILNIK